MDHVCRDIEPGFRREKDDAPPIALGHAGKIRTRQAHPGHDVHCEEALPFLIRCFKEVLRAENADIVDEDICCWLGCNQRGATRGSTKIRRNAAHLRAGNIRFPKDCLVSAQNIDFGNRGVLSASLDQNGQVSVNCSPSTP